jgi:uncharacterized protein YgbK (DUF1537 family)
MTLYRKVNSSYIFSSLPEEYPEDLAESILRERKQLNKTIVVLDDDPTGTQTVHGVPVLTEWSVRTLQREFKLKSNIFYILTNSRSLSASEANQVAEKVGKNLKDASVRSGRNFFVISRSDSTLRGHYPNEVEALKVVLENKSAIIFLIPAFFEGGRFTINDIHYVREGDYLVPVSLTPFAKDKSFSFTHSDLKMYVEEKTGGKIKAKDVLSFSIKDLRSLDESKIIDKIRKCHPGQTCIVNAVSYRDLQVFVLAMLRSGKTVLLRTAASIIPVLAGIEKRRMLDSEEFRTDHTGGILMVIGSYVLKTTIQLKQLDSEKDLYWFEVDVNRVLKEDKVMMEEYSEKINNLIKRNKDVVIYTSRRLVSVKNPLENLEIGNKVSNFLTTLVGRLRHRPKCILAKGGTTSSDTATNALGVKKAEVVGQVAAGVPVWKLGTESKFPGLKYVIFPGNVGDENTLEQVYTTIKGTV